MYIDIYSYDLICTWSYMVIHGHSAFLVLISNLLVFFVLPNHKPTCSPKYDCVSNQHVVILILFTNNSIKKPAGVQVKKLGFRSAIQLGIWDVGDPRRNATLDMTKT